MLFYLEVVGSYAFERFVVVDVCVSLREYLRRRVREDWEESLVRRSLSEREESGSYAFTEDIREEDVVVEDGEQESHVTEHVEEIDKDLELRDVWVVATLCRSILRESLDAVSRKKERGTEEVFESNQVFGD